MVLTLEKISRKLYQDSYRHLESDEKARVKRELKEAKREVNEILRASRRRP